MIDISFSVRFLEIVVSSKDRTRNVAQVKWANDLFTKSMRQLRQYLFFSVSRKKIPRYIDKVTFIFRYFFCILIYIFSGSVKRFWDHPWRYILCCTTGFSRWDVSVAVSLMLGNSFAIFDFHYFEEYQPVLCPEQH